MISYAMLKDSITHMVRKHGYIFKSGATNTGNYRNCRVRGRWQLDNKVLRGGKR